MTNLQRHCLKTCTRLNGYPPKNVELARIRRTLPPPPKQAPETESPGPHLKLKEIHISTMSHEDSVGKQPASRV